MVRVETLGPAHLEAVRRYSEVVWGPRSDEYFRWRFVEAPHVVTWLALVGDRCAALLSAMRKRYWIGGERADALEIFDWSSHPDFRGKGAGISVVQHAMRAGAPLFTLGGTEDTLRLLPRLGWKAAASAQVSTLPLRGTFVRRALGNRSAFGAAVGSVGFEAFGRAWFRSRRRAAGNDVRVHAVTEFGAVLENGDAGRAHAVVASPDRSVIAWADRGLPRPGHYLRFVARRDGRVCGWGLARLLVRDDATSGEIVDFFGFPPSAEVYDALVREMTACLAGLGADSVGATATCPLACDVIRRNRYVPRHDVPLLAFVPGGGALPSGPVHVMRGTADHLYLPLPAAI